jgi:heat shock protein beta
LDPLAHAHFTTEVHRITELLCYANAHQTLWQDFCSKQGEVEFRSVLYIPGMAPLSNEEIMNPKTKNIRLYVKRVFISDDFDGELVCCYNFFNCHFLILRHFFGYDTKLY